VSKLCDLAAGDVVCRVAWSQRGSHLSVRVTRVCTSICAQVSKLCDLAEGDVVCSVAWSQRGSYLSVGCSSGKVQIWDAAKMRMVRSMDGHRCVRVSSWFSWLYSQASRLRRHTCIQRALAHVHASAGKPVKFEDKSDRAIWLVDSVLKDAHRLTQHISESLEMPYDEVRECLERLQICT